MSYIYDILAKILTALYDLTGNFGLAIIGITIIVKIVTLPLTLKQDKSMRQMKLIQPKIDKIKEQYKGDTKLINQKTMELYQAEKINPAAGCLPLIIQMPLLFAMFGVLRISELDAVVSADIAQKVNTMAGSLGTVVQKIISGKEVWVVTKAFYTHLPHIPLEAGFLWLTLGKFDPFYILPLLNGGLSYLQQKLTGTSDSNPQMKMMMYMMPVMMIFISYKMPSGLQLYWVVSSLAGIIQQYWIIKRNQGK